MHGGSAVCEGGVAKPVRSLVRAGRVSTDETTDKRMRGGIHDRE